VVDQQDIHSTRSSRWRQGRRPGADTGGACDYGLLAGKEYAYVNGPINPEQAFDIYDILISKQVQGCARQGDIALCW
jgi:hypothetical protein